MKFVKLSVLALSMGLFVASCGNSSSDAAKTADSAATAAPAATPAATPAPAADTMNAGAAKPADTAKAPAADSKMEKKEEKKK